MLQMAEQPSATVHDCVGNLPAALISAPECCVDMSLNLGALLGATIPQPSLLLIIDMLKTKY